MERQQVITILESLANGVDPSTNAPIPYEAFQTADAIRALFCASQMLKDTGSSVRRGSVRKKTQLTSAGAPWAAGEDAKLCDEFDAGLTIAQIALQHGRTSGGIAARLVKLGKLDASNVKSRDRGAKVATG